MAITLDRVAKQSLDLLESGNFADAEIICKGKSWKVHKLILRSRCPWFEKAFANNWKEAQTGVIRLEEEEPDSVDHLLRYIYSGHYIPDMQPNVTSPYLELNVALWLTADFFLLPDLKAEVQEYLLERLALALWCFHDFRLSLVASEASQIDGFDQEDHDCYIVDFSKAVKVIYKNPGARQLHKLFAIFACGLRENWPAEDMRRLMKDVPQFQQDISTTLIALHFPKVTDEVVSGGLERLCVAEAWNAHSVWSAKDFISFRCSACGKESPKGATTRSSGKLTCNMTLDPFSLGTRKWCNDCAFLSMKSIMTTMLDGWPADVPVKE